MLEIIGPWLRMTTRGGKGSVAYLLGIRLRGNPVSLIIDAYTGLLHSGVIITLREVESHYVANPSGIMTAADLISSLRENPVDTHVAVWIQIDDAEWLGTHYSERASAIREELGRREESGEQGADSQLIIESQRCDRIATHAKGAVLKIQKAQGRV